MYNLLLYKEFENITDNSKISHLVYSSAQRIRAIVRSFNVPGIFLRGYLYGTQRMSLGYLKCQWRNWGAVSTSPLVNVNSTDVSHNINLFPLYINVLYVRRFVISCYMISATFDKYTLFTFLIVLQFILP